MFSFSFNVYMFWKIFLSNKFGFILETSLFLYWCTAKSLDNAPYTSLKETTHSNQNLLPSESDNFVKNNALKKRLTISIDQHGASYISSPTRYSPASKSCYQNFAAATKSSPANHWSIASNQQCFLQKAYNYTVPET